MKSLFLFIVTSIFATSALANDNPDQGSLMRLVCYKVSERGNSETRVPGLVIVIDQVDSEIYDGSFFVPGNDNYLQDLSQRIEFTVRVYKDTTVVDEEGDAQTIGAILDERQPTYSYEAQGARAREGRFFAEWESGSTVNYIPEDQTQSLYLNNVNFGGGKIYCEPPFAVADPNAQPVVEEGNQAAELMTEEATASEI